MPAFGISGEMHRPTEDFLSDRTINVGVGNENFVLPKVTGGDLHESVLRHLFSLLYTNDLAPALSPPCPTFLSDAKMV